ncbi:MAG: LamG domain-containing protein [Candidatus Poribacteria bacterium]|nr:LamG domain-containing protein [Candidatus Poribacteria bacterium]
MKFCVKNVAVIAAMCVTLTLTYTLTAHAAIDANTIKGMWLFDEATGATAADSSGNGNIGTLMGAASWVEGPSGNGVAFDGTVGSIVSIADSPSLKMSNAFTVMFWFRTGKTMVDMFGDRQIVMGKHYTEYEFGIYTAGQIHTYTFGRPGADGYDEGILATINGNLPSGDTDWVVDKWYHVAWTLNGAVETAYANGVMLDTFTKATPNTAPGTHTLEIGQRQGGSLPFLGAVDEVAVLNVALGEADIKLAYEQGLEVATGMKSPTAVEPNGKLAATWGALKTQ